MRVVQIGHLEGLSCSSFSSKNCKIGFAYLAGSSINQSVNSFLFSGVIITVFIIYTIFKTPPLFQTSPVIKPADEVGKLAMFTVPLNMVFIIDVFPITAILEPTPSA